MVRLIAIVCASGLAVGLLLVLGVYEARQSAERRRGAKIDGNQMYAVGSLRTIAYQQEAFKANCVVDQDRDMIGEYGYLCELSGEVAPRVGKATGPVSPVYLSRGFVTGGRLGKGFAESHGYRYRVYLLGKNGRATDDTACDGTCEEPGTMLDPETDQRAIDMQERHFVVYAWPSVTGVTGRRCFMISDRAGLAPYFTDMDTRVYSGSDCPSIDAAFGAARDDGWFSELCDSPEEGPGIKGNDGNVWYHPDS